MKYIVFQKIYTISLRQISFKELRDYEINVHQPKFIRKATHQTQ